MNVIFERVAPVFWPYLFLLVLTCFLGLKKWKQLGRPDRWVSILMVVTLVQEIVAKAIYIYGDRRDNQYTYNIYSPVEFFLISMYFGESIRYFRKRRIGIKMGIVGIVVSVLNILYVQPFSTFGNYYVFFEALCITIYCFFAFYQLLMQEDIQLLSLAAFWLTVCFMLYWCTTFAGWGLIELAEKKNHPTLVRIIDNTRKGSNYLFYAGVALVFLNYAKLKPSGE